MPTITQVTTLYDPSGLETAMEATQTPPELLVAFMGELERVRQSGWGSVVVSVQQGRIQMLEGKVTHLFAVERSGKGA